MDLQTIFLLCISFLLISFLYSSVGHAGASGYLAVMALTSIPIESIKPVSLVLNIVVSIIASYNFIRAGYFDRKVFLAFALTSIPMAFVGGYIKIDPHWFKVIAGGFLILSGILLLVRQFISPKDTIKTTNLPVALLLGAVIGLFSGLIGVGGGIFLSPILILLGYATIKNTAGISAVFILCNSTLGLAGHYASLESVPFETVYFAAFVMIGGYVGSHFGSRKFNTRIILSFLFVVLISAGIKFLVVG
ncbi:MAG: sulfite exporter TauE/SafE family protein [Cyclobacteriaceae bacterium]|nr:sulfite exporter TauE/SafE family protein [Cyclobacteriaceae bacterium]